MTPQPQTEHWSLLSLLAGRGKVAPERVSSLKRRWEQGPHEGAPFTLVVGEAKMLALLLARWQGVELARSFQSAGRLPLVAGQRPEVVQPPLGAWPGAPLPHWQGHLILLAADDALLPSMTHALGSLGVIDQAIIVTYLGQPFNPGERRLAASAAGIAALGKALIVALPGGEVSGAEANEAAALGEKVLAAAGFSGPRFGASGLWYTENSASEPGALARVEDLLEPRPDSAANGREVVLRAQLKRLVDDIEESVGAERAGTILEQEDLQDALRQFSVIVTRLGQRLEEAASRRGYGDAAALRRGLADTLTAWTAGGSMEAASLNYLESVRPGMKAALLLEAQAAAALLDLSPAASVSQAQAASISDGGTSGLGGRMACAMIAGGVGYALAYAGGSLAFHDWLRSLASDFCGFLAALTGWVASPWFLGRRAKASSGSNSRETPPVTRPSSLSGWPAVEQRLNAWFTLLATQPPVTVAEQCAALRSQLGLEKN